MKGIWIKSHVFQVFVDTQVAHLPAPHLAGAPAKWLPCEKCGTLCREPLNIVSTLCSPCGSDDPVIVPLEDLVPGFWCRDKTSNETVLVWGLPEHIPGGYVVDVLVKTGSHMDMVYRAPCMNLVYDRQN